MRGNERRHPIGQFLEAKFPIPMRGNELGEHHGAGGSVRQFPIPMRGNEVMFEGRAERRTGVPDPHEG